MLIYLIKNKPPSVAQRINAWGRTSESGVNCRTRDSAISASRQGMSNLLVLWASSNAQAS
eukprot:gene55683-74355_t